MPVSRRAPRLALVGLSAAALLLVSLPSSWTKRAPIGTESSGHRFGPNDTRAGHTGVGSRSAAAVRSGPVLVGDYGKLPLSFEINRGQTDARVKFLARGRGYALFLTGDEAVLSLRSQDSGVRSQEHEKRPWLLVPGPLQWAGGSSEEAKDEGQMTFFG